MDARSGVFARSAGAPVKHKRCDRLDPCSPPPPCQRALCACPRHQRSLRAPATRRFAHPSFRQLPKKRPGTSHKTYSHAIVQNDRPTPYPHHANSVGANASPATRQCSCQPPHLRVRPRYACPGHVARSASAPSAPTLSPGRFARANVLRPSAARNPPEWVHDTLAGVHLTQAGRLAQCLSQRWSGLIQFTRNLRTASMPPGLQNRSVPLQDRVQPVAAISHPDDPLGLPKPTSLHSACSPQARQGLLIASATPFDGRV